MVKVVDFSGGSHFAEAAIQRVGEKIPEITTRPEMHEATHEAIVKESIKSIAEKIPEIVPLVAPATSPQKTAPTSNSSLPAYLENDTDPNDVMVKETVEKLVNHVFTDGLEKAIAAAKKQPPFVEDAFHDALVEKIVPELRRRGVLR
jgi:hypothetical protein